MIVAVHIRYYAESVFLLRPALLAAPETQPTEDRTFGINYTANINILDVDLPTL